MYLNEHQVSWNIVLKEGVNNHFRKIKIARTRARPDPLEKQQQKPARNAFSSPKSTDLSNLF
jgi:hypothetical protein